MASRLINVRLDGTRWRKVRTLRAGGLPFSDLVREAIDRRFEERAGAARPLDAQAVLKRVFERNPDPPDLPPRPYNAHDRQAARRAILRNLRRRRR